MPTFELKVDNGFKLPKLPDPIVKEKELQNEKVKSAPLPNLDEFDFPLASELARKFALNQFKKFIKDNPAVYPFVKWLKENLEENYDQFPIILERSQIDKLFNPSVDDLYVLKGELEELGYTCSIYDDQILITF